MAWHKQKVMNEMLELQWGADQMAGHLSAPELNIKFKRCCYGSSFISNRNDSHNYCRTNFVLSRFKT